MLEPIRREAFMILVVLVFHRLVTFFIVAWGKLLEDGRNEHQEVETRESEQPYRMSEVAYQITKLVILLIFIDEFNMNLQTQRTYGLKQKGNTWRMLIRITELKMSLDVVHIPVRVEGIIGTNLTIYQLNYKHFLWTHFKSKAELKWDLSNVLIVADNWAFH